MDPRVETAAEIVRRVEVLLVDRAGRAALHSSSYVLEERRLLYVSTPKAACTSLKALLLRVAGVSPDALAGSTTAHPTAALLVHDRERFPLPSLATLDERARTRALVEDGWLRFCVVRDPYARLYSAWEDKVLVGDPALAERFRAPGVGDVLTEDRALDVRATFAAFVAELAREPAVYLSDWHFTPQHRVVLADALPYTDVVRLEQLDEFAPRLRAHVVAQGGADPGALPRSNSGLGVPWREAYDAETARTAHELYAEDFERWGYEPRREWPAASPQILAGELALIRRVREMNERITALSARATRRAAAEEERDRELAGRLRIERHATELGHAHEKLARAHAELVERYEQLAAAHQRLLTGDERRSP